MSSRRKQYKPKAAFGLTEQEQLELEKNGKIPLEIHKQQQENSNEEEEQNNERKRKRESTEPIEDEELNGASIKSNRIYESTEQITDTNHDNSQLNNTQNDVNEDAFDEEDDILDGEDEEEMPSQFDSTQQSQINQSQLDQSANLTMGCDPNNSSNMLLMFKCKVCGKAFKHRRSLNRHVKLHSGEKNFKCPYCTTAFARSDHLKAHIRTHNNSKPYRCSICQCGYSTQAALKVHIAHHHSKSKFKCVLCNDLEFHSQLALEGHIYTKHSKENADLNDLINETATMNPTLVPVDETNSFSLINQRTRLIDINNYSNISNNNQASNNKQNGKDYYSELDKSNGHLTMDENENENPLNSQSNLNNSTSQDEMNDHENNNDDDVIIEDTSNSNGTQGNINMTVSPNKQLIKIAPKPNPQSGMGLKQQGLNTFCELCNVRFSNVESYMVHMRNCHPSIPSTNNKMPYLTSILSNTKSINNSNTNNPIKSSSAIIIPLANNKSSAIPTTVVPASACTVPNCNCNMSVNRVYNCRPDYYEDMNGNGHDDYLVSKETHFTCVQCNLTMLKHVDYMQHIKKEHCVEVYRCILCKQMQLFDNLNLLKDHFFQVHQSHKYDLYKCKLCSNSTHSFNNLDDLGIHMKSAHNQSIDLNRYRVNSSSSLVYPPPPPPPPPPVQDRFKLFKCTYCDSDFAQQNSLQQHIQMVHPHHVNSNSNQQFPCQYCRNTFTNKSQLERHVRIHLSSIDLKCNICDRVFESEQSLSEHKLTHSKTNTFDSLSTTSSSSSSSSNLSSCLCAYCKQSIENEQQFKDHFKRHNNIGQPNSQRSNSYMCIVCKQTLTSNNEYNLHMRHHLKKNQPQQQQSSQASSTVSEQEKILLKCPKCPVKFEYGQDYNAHMKKFHPNECTSDMSSPQSPTSSTNSNNTQIKNERKSPNGIYQSQQQQQTKNDFLCEICSSKFDTQSKLQSHLIIKHEFINGFNGAFVCPVCDEAFSRADLLLQHTPNHGQAAKIYKCTQCTLAFVFKSQLINHSFSHQPASNHKQALQTTAAQRSQILAKSTPTQISKVATNVVRQPTPTKQNNFQTQQQPQQQQQQPSQNPTQPQYIVHTNSNGVKTYTCLTCSKTFANQRNLNVHIRIHTGFRPFECDVCKRKFTRRENLRSHMKCHLNLRPFSCSICNRSFRRKSHVVSHLEVHFKSKLHNCIECSKQFEELDVFLTHLISDHSIFDKELIQLIKQKNLLDLTQFNINFDLITSKPQKQNGQAGDSNNDSLTIQSLIDQSGKSDQINDLDYNYDENDNDESPLNDYNDEENGDMANYADNTQYNNEDELDEDNMDDMEDNLIMNENDELANGEENFEDNLNGQNYDENYMNAIDENGYVDDEIENDDEIDYTD